MWDESRRRFTSALMAGAAGAFASPLLLRRKQVESLPADEEQNLLRHELANQLLPNGEGNLTLIKPGHYAELRVDPLAGTITKRYHHGGINVNGEKIVLNERLLRHRYESEKDGYERLAKIDSHFLPENLVFDDHNRMISMKYYGPDLLTRMETQGFLLTAAMQEQLLQIFVEYRLAGFFKHNFYRSNILWDEANQRLVPIDYAEHVPRTPNNLLREIYKIAVTLPQFPKILEQGQDVFSDFSNEIVAPMIRAAFQPVGPQERPSSLGIRAAKICQQDLV